MKLVFFFILLVKTFFTDANIPQLDDHRIVGGEKICIKEHPYQVSLRHDNNHICGASIIHRDYVLTATHCVRGGPPRSYSIKAGSTHISSGGVIIKICDIIKHENYVPRVFINDITILKLCTSLDWKNKIKPVTLAGKSDIIAVGTLAVVSGWGHTRDGGYRSIFLQRVSVPIISNDLCQKIYRNEIITDDMLCAGYVGIGGKDSCQGDSGGPLFANGKQIGIVSWGYGCAQKKYPGVYTNVANYQEWIKNITHI